MSRRKFADVPEMLNDLLARYEAGSGAPLSYVDEDAFQNVEQRDRFHEQLAAAEMSGGIVVKRSHADGVSLIAHVRLVDADALYHFMKRVPAHLRTRDALSPVYARPGLPETAQEVLDELGRAWNRGVSRFNLPPYDSDALQRSLTLALAVEARAAQVGAQTTDYRTFSMAAGLDSKALERQLAAVMALHSRLFPARAPFPELEADDLLASYGIVRMPQPLLLSGPLRVGEVLLPDLPYMGFPPDLAERIELASPVRYTLTIENYASFLRHVREINGNRDGLVIFTGGFPARSHLSQIVRLAAEAQSPVFHWGDMDAGGLRIFRHLEKALDKAKIALRPHLMDSRMLLEYGAVPVGKRDLAPEGGEQSKIAEIWKIVSETRLNLEQEIIAPKSPGC
ncbi:Wadjet anti-phage system protein JetD domain-containing protein [Xanthobacter aminoxidans]|uniref:Wadjet anti-phage system protein JetD domain-containing protein n=1 Tax=Xanthobacter aminoxidans TaxID=186280 RepID=UPI00372A7410